MGVDTVVVPIINITMEGNTCNGMALKGVKEMKEVLHRAFKQGEGK